MKNKSLIKKMLYFRNLDEFLTLLRVTSITFKAVLMETRLDDSMLGILSNDYLANQQHSLYVRVFE